MEAAARHVARTSSSPWILALIAIIIYPILEEGFYRGLLLQFLRRFLPLWLAALLPALLFGLTHWGWSPKNAALAFVLALYLTWLAIRSRSLFSTIVCHSAVNFCTLFVLSDVLSSADIATPMGLAHPLPLLLLGISLVVLILGIRILENEFASQPTVVTT
jgi:membrane protease YdiL (CAAX protease family)